MQLLSMIYKPEGRTKFVSARMRSMKRLITFCTIITAAFYMQGQDASPGVLEGKVLDGYLIPVPFAHLQVKGTSYGAACNYFGDYKIIVLPGDTLQVTAISYGIRFVVVPAEIAESRLRLDIILKPDTIILSEVVVHPWPETYREFKEAFLGKIPGEEIAPPLNLGIPGPGELRNEAYSGGGIIMPGPVSVLYELLSREARNRRKYEQLLIRDMNDTLVYRRYNPSIVARLTGLSDAPAIDSLMRFCDLKTQTILSKTEYELYETILKCYREFYRVNGLKQEIKE
jgi:hypothetical protein